MNDNTVLKRFFNIYFYKYENTFEIYKYIGEHDHRVDNDCELHRGAEWEFYWGDVIRIQWWPVEPNKNHFLLFSPALGYNSGRRSPVKDYEQEPLIYLQELNRIEFVAGTNKEAHWKFDFCWGSSGGDMNSIDPETKIKETPH